MKTISRVLAFSLVAVAMGVSGRAAEAGWPGDCGYGGGYSWGFQRYALTNSQMPPYFAMFPPVYYRLPFGGRTYGASPYAYPPYQAAVQAPRPLVVVNRYVPSAPGAKGPAKVSENNVPNRPAPLIVINPYVHGDNPTPVAAVSR